MLRVRYRGTSVDLWASAHNLLTDSGELLPLYQCSVPLLWTTAHQDPESIQTKPDISPRRVIIFRISWRFVESLGFFSGFNFSETLLARLRLG